MPVKVKRGIKQSDLKKVFKFSQKEFNKRLPRVLSALILLDIKRGVSPVKGKGKFKKYSDSYKDVIRNKAAFRVSKKTGKVIRFDSQFLKGLTQKDVRVAAGSQSRAKSLIGQLKSTRAKRKKLVEELNSEFHRKANPPKQVSPVTMRHTGKMLNALRIFVRGKLVNNDFRIRIEIKDRLAVIHNNKGAGKSKVIRRLLPTEPGEQFNPKIVRAFRRTVESILVKAIRKFNIQSQ